MPFVSGDINRVHPGGHPRLYTHYTAVNEDPAAAGYFNDLAAELNVGDMIIVHIDNVGAHGGVYVLAVAFNDGSTVSVTGGEMAP